MKDHLFHLFRQEYGSRQIMFQFLLLTGIALFTLPGLFLAVSIGLENSWQFALHRCTLSGLQYGKDIIFTYGPLGYLRYPFLLSKNLWIQSVGYLVSIHLLFFAGVFLLLKKAKADWVNSLILAIAVTLCFRITTVLRQLVEFEYLLTLFIFTYLYLEKKDTRAIFGGLLAILYSPLLFIKFSDGIIGSFLFITFLLLLFIQQRKKEMILIVSTYLLVSLFLGLLLIGNLADITLFLYNSLQMANGYPDAMSLNGREWQFQMGVLCSIFYVGLIVYHIYQKNSSDLEFLFLAAGLFFFTFRYGFVRQDGIHVLPMLLGWISLFLFYYLIISYRNMFMKHLILVVSCLLFISFLIATPFSYTWFSPKVFSEQFLQIKTALLLLRDMDFENSPLIRGSRIKRDYSYDLHPDTLRLISDHTIDVFPSDLTIAEYYQFKWIPRPSLQSYAVLNDYLDLANEKHFRSSHAPDFILYSLQRFDNRYPLFDEPATLRTLFRMYQPEYVDADFILLRKKERMERIPEHSLFRTSVKMGEIIPLPKGVSGYLFARIYINYTTLGRIMRFLYKVPEVSICFIRNGRVTSPYRLIISTARNGILLTGFIKDTTDLFHLWKEGSARNLEGIIISTQNKEYYRGLFQVEFFVLPKIG